MGLLNHTAYVKKLRHERDTAVAGLADTMPLHYHKDVVKRLEGEVERLEAQVALMPAAKISVTSELNQWLVVVNNSGGLTARFRAKVGVVSAEGWYEGAGPSTQMYPAQLSQPHLDPGEDAFFALGETSYFEDSKKPAAITVTVPIVPKEPARKQLHLGRVKEGKPPPAATIKVTVTSEPTLRYGYATQYFRFTTDGLALIPKPSASYTEERQSQESGSGDP